MTTAEKIKIDSIKKAERFDDLLMESRATSRAHDTDSENNLIYFEYQDGSVSVFDMNKKIVHKYTCRKSIWINGV